MMAVQVPGVVYSFSFRGSSSARMCDVWCDHKKIHNQESFSRNRLLQDSEFWEGGTYGTLLRYHPLKSYASRILREIMGRRTYDGYCIRHWNMGSSLLAEKNALTVAPMMSGLSRKRSTACVTLKSHSLSLESLYTTLLTYLRAVLLVSHLQKKRPLKGTARAMMELQLM